MKVRHSTLRKAAWTALVLIPVLGIWGFTMDGSEKVTICHIPPGNPENAHTITVGESAVAAHLENHGDYIGACGEGQEGQE
jgi:hypothetical protein